MGIGKAVGNDKIEELIMGIIIVMGIGVGMGVVGAFLQNTTLEEQNKSDAVFGSGNNSTAILGNLQQLDEAGKDVVVVAAGWFGIAGWIIAALGLLILVTAKQTPPQKTNPANSQSPGLGR